MIKLVRNLLNRVSMLCQLDLSKLGDFVQVEALSVTQIFSLSSGGRDNVCWNYQQGNCSREDCKFLHVN